MSEVAQFLEITGATPEQASFFLSLAGNNVDAAIASFFENDGDMAGAAMDGVEEGVAETSAPVRKKRVILVGFAYVLTAALASLARRLRQGRRRAPPRRASLRRRRLRLLRSALPRPRGTSGASPISTTTTTTTATMHRLSGSRAGTRGAKPQALHSVAPRSTSPGPR